VRTATIVASLPSLRHSLANESAESFTPPMSERPGSLSTAEVYAREVRADRCVYPALREGTDVRASNIAALAEARAAAVTYSWRMKLAGPQVPPGAQSVKSQWTLRWPSWPAVVAPTSTALAVGVSEVKFQSANGPSMMWPV